MDEEDAFNPHQKSPFAQITGEETDLNSVLLCAVYWVAWYLCAPDACYDNHATKRLMVRPGTESVNTVWMWLGKMCMFGRTDGAKLVI